MKAHTRVIAFLILMLSNPMGWTASLPALSIYSGQWVLEEQSGKVSIYLQTFEQTSFAAFKAEAVLDQPLASLLAVIADPASCSKWVDGCIHSEAAGGLSFNDRLGYAENALPWPLNNRDIVVRIRTQAREEWNIVEVSMVSTESEAYPETSDLIRVKDSLTLYHLEALSENQTRLIWVQYADPAGQLPAWLVNSKLIDLPAKSIPRLEALAGTERYQDSQLIYDPKGNLQDLALNSGVRVSSLYKLTDTSSIAQAKESTPISRDP